MNLAATVRKRLASGFELDVNVAVPSGITMVFGASGAGKTTLLRCLAGLARPDHGRIAMGDRVVFDSETGTDVPARVRNIGYVFQQLALFPHLSVAQNIEYGLARFDATIRRKKTQAIADSFGITHLLERRPDDVSGGERQRTALARSLVTDPGVLLLDEPLSALDLPTKSRIMADLRVWNAARAIPILYVTHAHREVFALGERVIVLGHGKIEAEGTPRDVLEAPAHESVAQLAGFENFFDARLLLTRPEAGTMLCRLERAATELEVPLSHVQPGLIVRVAIRAGDILLATEEPRGLSARNILPGVIESLAQEGATVIAVVQAGGRFEVHLTPSACEALRLARGRQGLAGHQDTFMPARESDGDHMRGDSSWLF